MMIRAGLMGIGFMGRGHLNHFQRLEEEHVPLRLSAIADCDALKFKNQFVPGNLNLSLRTYDFSRYAQYTDWKQMLDHEPLDMVDIALPTHLHAEAAVAALEKGIHVLVEKPMARTVEEARRMVDAAQHNGCKLMVGQCLRFHPVFEYLREVLTSETFGKVNSAFFYRYSSTPSWSYQDWLRSEEKSGSALLDLHVHDLDMIHWIFGRPNGVSTLASHVIPGSGFDVASTHYHYPDGKVVSAQVDWTLNGDHGFKMGFLVGCNDANLRFADGTLTVCPHDGAAYVPDVSGEDCYYREIRYFAKAILEDTALEVVTPESALQTIEIALAETESARRHGERVNL